jgi:hypothetical protein
MEVRVLYHVSEKGIETDEDHSQVDSCFARSFVGRIKLWTYFLSQIMEYTSKSHPLRLRAIDESRRYFSKEDYAPAKSR